MSVLASVPKTESESHKEILDRFALALKKQGIHASKEELPGMMGSAASLTVDLLYSLSDLSENEKKVLKVFLKDKKTHSKQPIRLKKVISLIKINKKLLSAYVETNFTSPLIKSAIGESNSLERLIENYISSKEVVAVNSVIDAMLDNEQYYDVGYMLKNSDPVTQIVFVKEILPTLIQAAINPSLLTTLSALLRSVASSKRTHFEFFKVLEAFRDLIFLLGPLDEKNFREFLRCIS